MMVGTDTLLGDMPFEGGSVAGRGGWAIPMHRPVGCKDVWHD
jgi:hypothetical protein